MTLGLHEGFVDEDHRWVLLTEHELFDRYHKYTLRSDKASSGKVTLSLKEIQSFSRGDLIVHADHGIGRFDGLVSMPQGDHMQEFVKLVYRNNDTIYVNLHSLHKLSHYRSGEGGKEVTLSAVGSGAWQRIKERTKKRIKDIARDLIRLYAKRRETEGFAFSPDTYLQHELEASFAFEDTPDQAAAVTAVEGRYGAPLSDGPSPLWGCRLREDGGSRACRLQGCHRRQAGRRPRPYDGLGIPALPHLLQATEGLPRPCRLHLPCPHAEGASRHPHRPP